MDNPNEGERPILGAEFPPNRPHIYDGLVADVANINERLNTVSADIRGLAGVSNISIEDTGPQCDPEVVRNHVNNVIANWRGNTNQNFYELSAYQKILNAFVIENYQGRALRPVLARCREVLAATWTSWRFVKLSTTATNLQSINVNCDNPKVTLPREVKNYRQGPNGKAVKRKSRKINYGKTKSESG